MLNNFNDENFLTKYWQKAPCLIKQAYSDFPQYISAEELAGLAMEEDVESRLISNIQQNWQIQHGPFIEEDFTQLPESHWTLLVQTMDYWLPELNQLLDDFRFIPRWRFDDVMISFATDAGGVGPHFDNYDVFLIQAEGERHWRAGKKGDTKATQNKINGLLHLEYFDPIIDVVMQAGDILYIPPDTPHWGVSIGNSIGYSVGYRAPQTKDILGGLAEYFENSELNQFFTDEYRSQINNNNHLEPELIQWAQAQLKLIVNNHDLIKEILSKTLSQPKIDSIAEQDTHLNLADLKKQSIQLKPGLNYNWYNKNEQIVVTIEGELFYFEQSEFNEIDRLLKGDKIKLLQVKQNSSKFAFYQTLARINNKGYFLTS